MLTKMPQIHKGKNISAVSDFTIFWLLSTALITVVEAGRTKEPH